MICNPNLEYRPPEVLLARHLASDVERVCGRTRFDYEGLEELARGVASYCFNELGGPMFDSEAVSGLLCRALWRAGDQRSAAVWMDRSASAASFRDTALELCRHEELPAVLLYAAANSVIKYVKWINAEDSYIWILDLKKLHDTDVRYELLFYTTLRSFLGQFAAVWNETKGRGILGLQGCEEIADRIFNEDPSRRERQLKVAEFKSFCSHFLLRYGQGRGWNDSPEVVHIGA